MDLEKIKENLKEQSEKNKKRREQPHLPIVVSEGKKDLGLGVFSSSVVMRQNDNGYVYFDTMPDTQFKLIELLWNGPQYRTVTNSATVTKKHGKTKRKGGLGGALIGTALLPGAGTIIGYSMGSKKVYKGKDKSATQTVENQEEVPVPATVKMMNVETKKMVAFTFDCTQQLANELSIFNWASDESKRAELEQSQTANNVQQQGDNIKLLQQYKELLDQNIITQEDFDKKKKELLEL